MAHIGVRVFGQFAGEAGHEAELRVRVGKGTEVFAVQQLLRRACAQQQHHFHATFGDQLFQLRQHGACLLYTSRCV